ncbi:MarR family winged helix-turn-helix transcriptional regulator [Ruania halotolerans]|uniref:MarR family winged helix-turn-helix transcriptional regulator n=1 Tax=Ruania halotolerans TaxID=2897773 RepID=UPI001E3AA6E2|nr:MarR family winged helix-turn-helix transcriptional regulator [Ruania halotolerans]UFU06917.1 MarR family winged helix-turn-helix transcriptional regulator [Ruania halotolerans]
MMAHEEPVRDAVDEIAEAWSRELPGAPVESIGVITRIWRIAHLLENDRRSTMQRLGMEVSTRSLLATLRRAGEPYVLAPSEIARRAGVSAGAVSQWVSRAERDGWVVRRRGGGSDGRAVEVALTDAGRTRIDDVVGELLEHEAGLVAALDDEEVAQLSGLLRQLMAGLGKRAGERATSPESSAGGPVHRRSSGR